jgi:peptidoglycan/xylan/chitin deacetylase (PgdA/CDA1 family)
MTLPADYLEYPRRRHGNDHDRYGWSPLPTRKPLEWPGRARVALWLCPVLEFFPLDMGATPFRAPGALDRPYPDYWNYTWRDYGNRVGAWRLFKAFADRGLSASVVFNLAVAERCPPLLSETLARGWEVVAGGVDMGRLHHSGLAPGEEAGLIDATLDGLRRLSGQPVRGWMSPAQAESHQTPDLLAARGVAWTADWVADDLPMPLVTATGSLWAMPMSHELNDLTLIHANRRTAAAYAQQITDAFDWLYAEAGRRTDAGGGGRVLCLPFHPWLTGVPHRIGAVEQALDHILARAGVWSATAGAILDAAVQQSRGTP